MLSDVFNQLIREGVFPKILKIAKVMPIHKRGFVFSPNNYRSISLVSPFSKLLEKLILVRLNSFLTRNNVIHNQQFGFRKKYSTSLAIADVISQIKYCQDNNYFTCVILLDLKKAFDTVDHELLLSKLEKYGIRGNIHSLFKSYLTDRKQYVCVNNCCSDCRTITCGVPQGSILGPTLFSLYINDTVND